jgi:hypothetical protein
LRTILCNPPFGGGSDVALHHVSIVAQSRFRLHAKALHSGTENVRHCEYVDFRQKAFISILDNKQPAWVIWC